MINLRWCNQLLVLPERLRGWPPLLSSPSHKSSAWRCAVNPAPRNFRVQTFDESSARIFFAEWTQHSTISEPFDELSPRIF